MENSTIVYIVIGLTLAMFVFTKVRQFWVITKNETTVLNEQRKIANLVLGNKEAFYTEESLLSLDEIESALTELGKIESLLNSVNNRMVYLPIKLQVRVGRAFLLNLKFWCFFSKMKPEAKVRDDFETLCRNYLESEYRFFTLALKFKKTAKAEEIKQRALELMTPLNSEILSKEFLPKFQAA